MPAGWRASSMQDSFHRTIDYLRLSVTEACNFRCAYCAPDGPPHARQSALTLAEIEQVVRAAVSLGIGKLRLTGGEPLLRREIVELVRAIAALDGVRDLSLTTNGFRLAELAPPLAAAGLRRVNVSLDTLRPDRFARLTGRDAFAQVWQGILAAEAVGLTPLKLNVVALRGINDDELEEFARLTRERAWHVRFIELMPVGGSAASREWYERHFIAASELAARLPDLEPIAAPAGSGPARTFRLAGARGTLGFITPASQHFCAACNRIRVTARGVVRPCLFGSEEIDLRNGHGGLAADVEARLERAIRGKPEQHPWGSGFVILKQGMSQIGG